MQEVVVEPPSAAVETSVKPKGGASNYNTMKYRSFLNQNGRETATEEVMNQFLNMDIERNRRGNWSKLSKTEKCKHIKDYIDNILTKQYNLSEEDQQTAFKFFTLLIDKKKLSKNTELNYNKEDGFIEHVVGLIFNPASRKFAISADTKVKTVKRTVKLEASKLLS
jgi:hypothetical protein